MEKPVARFEKSMRFRLTVVIHTFAISPMVSYSLEPFQDFQSFTGSGPVKSSPVRLDERLDERSRSARGMNDATRRSRDERLDERSHCPSAVLKVLSPSIQLGNFGKVAGFRVAPFGFARDFTAHRRSPAKGTSLQGAGYGI